MLELKNITKNYLAGPNKVAALRGVSLQFRKSEFVAILGPSGCGKTTLLNIIGGLDQYTDGDLVINGRSTKHYKDRDWDSYRNHSIGFVFQSYNLIPHQTVLANVELALTLSGVSKRERRQRAKDALARVGLGDQLRKKPNQLSGGQMQRVAIARAIVNDPDIILADEPTGALDTQTSIQVMEILKEISQDRLVVMVTHNPELADQYASRTVRMLDGLLTEDTAPLTQQEIDAARQADQQAEEERKRAKKKEKKPSMSWLTSFGLSLKNLISKKGRTILTAFAGSIGIIGIALIYAVSQGMTTYINTVQEETLSSYPLTIEAESVNLSTLLETFVGQAQAAEPHDNDAVYQKAMFYNLVNAMANMETSTNDLKSFKVYLEEQLANKDSPLSQSVSGVLYGYNLDMLVYTKNVDGTILRADTQALMQELLIEYFGMDISSMMDMSNSYGMQSMASFSPMGDGRLFQEMLPGKDGKPVSDLLLDQYDVLAGSWPNSYNEIVLVVDENNEIDDLTLYALGLKHKSDIDALAQASLNKTPLEPKPLSWSYQELMDMEFRVVFGADCYTLDEGTGLYTDLRATEAGLEYLYNSATTLKISGIIRPKEDALATVLKGNIGYTTLLTEYVIEESKSSPAIQAQLDSPHKDIFTGLPFRESTGELTVAQKAQAFRDHVAQLTDREKAETYLKIMSIPAPQELEAMVAQAMDGQTRETMQATMLQVLAMQTGMSETELEGYISSMTDQDVEEFYRQLVTEQAKVQYAAGVQAQLAQVPAEQLVAALDMAMSQYTESQCADYYDQILEFSAASYDENLLTLGCLDLESPAAINLYAVSFESKDTIEAAIATYNEGVDELHRLSYTDYVGLMMNSITTIINAITYVLIAFVAVSLVVSSIMIGVITLISVQERTKEIGVLRAIGASKRNVSNMFNAETIMIGFAAGTLGVLVTKLLCIPINAILHHLTGIANLQAFLPWPVAFLLIGISVVLTTIAGVIPARSAAKKDPVVALRTE